MLIENIYSAVYVYISSACDIEDCMSCSADGECNECEGNKVVSSDKTECNGKVVHA